MTTLRRRSVLVGSVAAVLGTPAIVQAQNVGDWPRGPIKIIVPFPPGGSTDPVARIIQAKLADNTGWQVLIDNRPAAPASSAPRSPPSRRPTARPG